MWVNRVDDVIIPVLGKTAYSKDLAKLDWR